MHSSGFDDAATEPLTIEAPPARLWDLLTLGGDRALQGTVASPGAKGLTWAPVEPARNRD
jgi:hypothetical protein